MYKCKNNDYCDNNFLCCTSCEDFRKCIKDGVACEKLQNGGLKMNNLIINIKLWIKRVKCAMFCNKPFELLNYCEKIDKGIVGAVRCPKCGNEMFILNKRK